MKTVSLVCCNPVTASLRDQLQFYICHSGSVRIGPTGARAGAAALITCKYGNMDYVRPPHLKVDFDFKMFQKCHR